MPHPKRATPMEHAAVRLDIKLIYFYTIVLCYPYLLILIFDILMIRCGYFIPTGELYILQFKHKPVNSMCFR